MQPTDSTLASATLCASGRGGRPGGTTRQRAVKLCASTCLMLLLCAVPRPAAAQPGICSADNPHVTVFSLVSKSGYELKFTVRLDGYKVKGLMRADAVGQGPDGASYGALMGTVNGNIHPGNWMDLQVNLPPPAPEGTQILIKGTIHEGGGQGTLIDTSWSGDDAVPRPWKLKTPDGCPKWPEDVLRSDLAKAAEAYADQAAPALAAADPLYACDADAWSLSGSFGHEFMSGCLKEAAKVFPWDTSGYPEGPRTRLTSTRPGSMPWKACEAALNKRVNALIEAMRPTCDRAKRLTAAKNRCVPAHTTADGKIYQNVPRPFTDEGKDVQLCMNHVQGCFDRNAGKEAQESCASQVVGCFDFGNDARVNAAAKLFGAGAINAAFGTKARASGADLFCLSIRPASEPGPIRRGKTGPFLSAVPPAALPSATRTPISPPWWTAARPRSPSCPPS